MVIELGYISICGVLGYCGAYLMDEAMLFLKKGILFIFMSIAASIDADSATLCMGMFSLIGYDVTLTFRFSPSSSR